MKLVRSLMRALSTVVDHGQLGPMRDDEWRDFVPGRSWSTLPRARSRRQ